MQKPQIPNNESLRSEALNGYKILDTLPEEEYDALTRIAAEICGTPMALVSLIDPNRQWFKSHHGLDASETPRDLAFCAHAINTPNELFIIPDASKDERFRDNPLSVGSPNVMFYAGAPLNTKEGYSLGTLCVIDTKPREDLTIGQKETLQALAKQVMSQLELRKKNRDLEELNSEVTRMNCQLNHFAHRLTHDLKTPIRGVSSLIGFIKEDYKDLIKDTDVEKWLELIHSRIEYMDFLINGILEYTKVNNNQIDFEDFNIEETIQYVLNNGNLDIPIHLELNNCNKTIHHSKIGFIQIIQNLLSNSVKHTDKTECKISVSLEENAESFSFNYEDNGPGIPEKYWEKVFELFETLNQNKTNNAGIGLATIKSIVDKMGGVIYLKERENKESGVCFHFVLPKKEKL
ncbi:MULTISPECIES: sensor histidine kinase [Flavobacterium]|uniref:histidine kinase n=1 Tax=Flavobacterium jumunjinense TaxID=998845 RepID=A0ABV5GRX8_9FLAO|nr:MULTISPECIES: GAF domain-containing sensor histidine kinase [Flavobacterium]